MVTVRLQSKGEWDDTADKMSVLKDGAFSQYF